MDLIREGSSSLVKVPTAADAKTCAKPFTGECKDGQAGECWCDILCTWFNDCCADYSEVCLGPGPPMFDSKEQMAIKNLFQVYNDSADACEVSLGYLRDLE